VRREIGRHVHAIEFVVIRFGQVAIQSVFDDHVTGRAGAVPTACVLQVNSEIDGDIKQRLGLAMSLIGQLAGLEFDGLADREESHLGHSLYYSGFNRLRPNYPNPHQDDVVQLEDELSG